jgi:hypothetical protein
MLHEPAIVAPALPTVTDVLEGGRHILDRLGKVAAERFPGKVVGHLAAGSPWREIVQFAANLHADLIVVGTHDRKGIKRLVLGSVAESVAKNAQCAVLVARAKDYHTRDVPEIEPPCPDCLVVQRESAGEKLWCERHAAHHPHGRIHYDNAPPSFGQGSQIIR